MKREKGIFKREAIWTLILGLAPIFFWVLMLLLFRLIRMFRN